MKSTSLSTRRSTRPRRRAQAQSFRARAVQHLYKRLRAAFGEIRDLRTANEELTAQFLNEKAHAERLAEELQGINHSPAELAAQLRSDLLPLSDVLYETQEGSTRLSDTITALHKLVLKMEATMVPPRTEVRHGD